MKYISILSIVFLSLLANDSYAIRHEKTNHNSSQSTTQQLNTIQPINNNNIQPNINNNSIQANQSTAQRLNTIQPINNNNIQSNSNNNSIQPNINNNSIQPNINNNSIQPNINNNSIQPNINNNSIQANQPTAQRLNTIQPINNNIQSNSNNNSIQANQSTAQRLNTIQPINNNSIQPMNRAELHVLPDGSHVYGCIDPNSEAAQRIKQLEKDYYDKSKYMYDLINNFKNKNLKNGKNPYLKAVDDKLRQIKEEKESKINQMFDFKKHKLECELGSDIYNSSEGMWRMADLERRKADALYENEFDIITNQKSRILDEVLKLQERDMQSYKTQIDTISMSLKKILEEIKMYYKMNAKI